MRASLDEKLQCPLCNQPITRTYPSAFVRESSTVSIALYSCSCQTYPEIGGILYLKNDKAKRRAVQHIYKHNYLRAFFALCQTNRYLKSILFILFYPHVINRFIKTVTGKHICQVFGIKNAIRLLAPASTPLSWIRYVQTRDNLASYHIAAAASTIALDKGYLLDIGCGVGQLLPLYQSAERLVVGIDKLFMNLLFANNYVASSNTRLVCAQVEEGIPYSNNSFSTIVVVDSLHYMKEKSSVMNEITRTLATSGMLQCIQVLSYQKPQEEILGISPKKLEVLLKNCKFSLLHMFSNAHAWSLLRARIPIPINLKKTEIPIKTPLEYSVIAVKKEQKIFYSVDNTKQNIKTNYRNESLLQALLSFYDSFVFLSPHLDDAVLSCGDLMEHLKKNNKEIQVVSFFTQARANILSPFIRLFLSRCDSDNAEALFAQRRQEDTNALHLFHAKLIHYNYLDAGWRTNSKGFYYPTVEDVFSGTIHPDEKLLSLKITKRLLFLQKQARFKKTMFFAPLGIGNHVDHVIIHKASQSLQSPMLYWEDVPYNMSPGIKGDFLFRYPHYQLVLPYYIRSHLKMHAIKKYKTQLKGLFSDSSVHTLSEHYYRFST